MPTRCEGGNGPFVHIALLVLAFLPPSRFFGAAEATQASAAAAETRYAAIRLRDVKSKDENRIVYKVC